MERGKVFYSTKLFGLIWVSILLSIYSCNSNVDPSATAETGSKLPQSEVGDTAEIKGLVVAKPEFVLKQTHKPKQLVLGKSYKTAYKNLQTLYIGTNNIVMDFVEKHKLGLKGSLLSVYNEYPTQKGDITIFVGIPVDRKVECKTAGLEYFEIPEGNYHKITGNAEIGKAESLWEAAKEAIEKNDEKITFPVFEYPSDSRNSEMTTVIKQCNLLIPEK